MIAEINPNYLLLIFIFSSYFVHNSKITSNPNLVTIQPIA
ncbi:hypothetical protein HMPREF0496_1211 [Lentilactobacillus hilgardii ATCC 27305]|nr:hypothetical protein HMPREF0496_1211 [Lentilactobacillus hilgardii ATCC 27305]